MSGMFKEIRWPLLTTGLVIVVTPIILVCMIFQGPFIKGLAEGALKG